MTSPTSGRGRGQRAGHILVSRVEEQRLRPGQDGPHALRLVEVPGDWLHARRELRLAARPDQRPYRLAVGEFPDPAHPAHRAAVAVKAWVRDRFGQLTATLAGDGRAARPELLADQLSLVMEGTYASAQARAADGPARHARTVAASLLDVSR